MLNTNRLVRSAAFVLILIFAVAGVSATAPIQEKITIQAMAWGTSTQMGRQVPVKIIINALSTPHDRKTLIEAFNSSGQAGMLKVLEKMKPKGRIALEGRVGNDVKYIIELPSKEGRRFRLVTDRNLAFGELYNGTRSRDYDIGGAELTITSDDKTGSGTLLPACKIKMNKKQKQVEIESYQNPWKLQNFIVHKG
jgi:hypothetical protein